MIKIKQFIKSILKNATIFFACGGIYYGLEEIFKSSHTSHWTMFVCAGLIGLLASLLNNFYSFDMLLQYQLGISSVIATVCEGITGILICYFSESGANTVWDYSELPLTFFFGQCNLFFSFLWAILSFIAILIGDSIEYYVFDESERPYYCINSHGVWFWLPRKTW